MTTHIDRRTFLKSATAGAAALAVSRYSISAVSGRKPNFVFILIDDMGWTDLSCYGSTFYETPNIDRLASRGMKFTDAYAACPVCSPTRASIMTGKYPARLHLTDWITGHVNPTAKLRVPDWKMFLDHREVTIAEALKPAGYVSASIGKWHLGSEEYYPEKQGFDVNIAGYSAGQPPTYFYPYTVDREWNNQIPTMTGGSPGEYLTDRLTDEALTFMEENRDRPFFLYLTHYAVHTPIEGKEAYTEKFRARVRPGQAQNNPVYASMVQSVDDSVGRVMDRLEELGIAENTIIFFMSDNGGLIGEGRFRKVTSNLPLRDGKGTPYEGGIREPMIVRWPGIVKPGSVCDTPVTSVDFYPTILAMAGIPGNEEHNRTVDGVDITLLLRRSGAIDERAIYWHYPHYHPLGASPFGAVRAGDFKLIEFYEDFRVELYNLADDIGEANDRAGELPGKAGELREMLHAWRESVDAQMPTPNPQYRGE